MLKQFMTALIWQNYTSSLLLAPCSRKVTSVWSSSPSCNAESGTRLIVTFILVESIFLTNVDSLQRDDLPISWIFFHILKIWIVSVFLKIKGLFLNISYEVVQAFELWLYKIKVDASANYLFSISLHTLHASYFIVTFIAFHQICLYLGLKEFRESLVKISCHIYPPLEWLLSLFLLYIFDWRKDWWDA